MDIHRAVNAAARVVKERMASNAHPDWAHLFHYSAVYRFNDLPRESRLDAVEEVRSVLLEAADELDGLK